MLQLMLPREIAMRRMPVMVQKHGHEVCHHLSFTDFEQDDLSPGRNIDKMLANITKDST